MYIVEIRTDLLLLTRTTLSSQTQLVCLTVSTKNIAFKAILFCKMHKIKVLYFHHIYCIAFSPHKASEDANQ